MVPQGQWDLFLSAEQGVTLLWSINKRETKTTELYLSGIFPTQLISFLYFNGGTSDSAQWSAFRTLSKNMSHTQSWHRKQPISPAISLSPWFSLALRFTEVKVNTISFFIKAEYFHCGICRWHIYIYYPILISMNYSKFCLIHVSFLPLGSCE